MSIIGAAVEAAAHPPPAPVMTFTSLFNFGVCAVGFWRQGRWPRAGSRTFVRGNQGRRPAMIAAAQALNLVVIPAPLRHVKSIVPGPSETTGLFW